MEAAEKLRASGIGLETGRDRFLSTLEFDPGFGEYLRAKLGQGFDYTTTRMIIDDVALYNAEVAAYGKTDEYQGMGRDLLRLMGETGAEMEQQHYGEYTAYKNPVRWTQEQYKESEYYREGIDWKDGWTEVRARVMAEQYDLRRYREAIIENADVGVLGSVVGFGAGLLGSLPDPINLIPFGQGFSKARLGYKLLAGAVDGAAGNAVANAIVFPDLIMRGEDLGFADFAADIGAGLVLGTGLAGAGHGFSKGLNALASQRTATLNRAINDAAAATGAEMAEFKAQGIDVSDDIRPVVSLTGREMLTDLPPDMGGQPLSLKQLKDSALNYYRKNLQGKTAVNPELGEVHFTGRGIKKFLWTSADDAKPKMLPAVKTVIERGQYLGPEEIAHTRKDGIVRFHRVGENVQLGGEVKYISVLIGENRDGKLFYNLNADAGRHINVSDTNARVPAFAPGPAGIRADASVSDKANITQKSQDVNIEIHDAKTVAEGMAAVRTTIDKRNLRQLLHGADKKLTGDALELAIIDAGERGLDVNVKPVIEKMPAYQKLSDAQKRALFPQETMRKEAPPPDPNAADKSAEAYGLEALDEIGRMRAEGRLTDDELLDMDAADADVKKAESIGGAVKNFIGCMFGM